MLVWVALAATVPAAASQLGIVGQVGGRTEDVAVQGDYAYAAVGLRMVVLDVSHPGAPTEIGSTTPLPEFVEGVAVDGSLACVADGMAGLFVIDVSDPTSPVVVGSYDTPGYSEGVTVAGRYAYVADGHCGLRIVDISDPASPTEAAYACPLNFVFDIAIDGRYAYLAAAGAGLLVVDVSEPTHPVEVAAHDTPGYAFGVDVAAGVAYVADGWEDLRMVGVSDPTHPVELASHETPGWAFGLRVAGGRAYVADAFGGLQVVDVSDPASPAALGGYEVAGGHAGRVAVAGDAAFVADRNRGLHVFDVSDPSEPARIGFHGPMGRAVEVAVSGDYAYVAAATFGLRVVDVSDPGHPTEVAGYDVEGYATTVAVVGEHAYVVATNGFHVIDISDPRDPVAVGFLDPVVGSGRDIVVVGTIAYIPDEHGLRLLDVSIPSAPTVAGYIDFRGDEEWGVTTGVDVAGPYAYVSGDGGFYVVDVSDPTSPTLVTRYGPGGFDVAVVGQAAYLTGAGESLTIVDISNPHQPFRVGGYSGPHGAERVAVADGTAYIGGGTAGLQGIDVTDPTDPVVAFSGNTPGYAFAAAVRGDYAFVADHEGGLVILDTRSAAPGTRGAGRSVPTAGPTARGNSTSAPPDYGSHRSRLEPRRRAHEEFLRTSPSPRGEVRPRSGARMDRIPETCVVTNADDTGPGSLRACLEGVSSGDTITFDPDVFPPDDPAAIALVTGLPGLWQGGVTIDGSDAGVILDGSEVLDGIGLSVSSSNNVVRGLQVVGFSVIGIAVAEGGNDNTIGGDRMVGRGPTGQGNQVSGNRIGIEIHGHNNTIAGNLVGTDAAGLHPFGNDWQGIWIVGGSDNTIGGTTPGERNVISANRLLAQVDMHFARGNVVIGNYIGTDITGTVDLGDAGTGVSIDGSQNNLVKDNLISGSNWGAVSVTGWGSSYNVVVGNLIGTDASGTYVLGNRWAGIAAGFGGADFNLIGGTKPGAGNVVGGNPQGVNVTGTGNLVLGNLIGTDITGSEAIANHVGLFVGDAGYHSFVGGTTLPERNVISGSGEAGVRLGGGERNFVLGNFIGTDASGASALPNGESGIEGASDTVVQGNVIAGNAGQGVNVGRRSQLRANRIGVAADGVTPLPNGAEGVAVGGDSNRIGGSRPEDGNTIAHNAADGVWVWGSPRNTIRGNSIHGNAGSGIELVGGGNAGLPAPVITEVSRNSVSGTACPGCVVEIFSDQEDEGSRFEGNTTADASGAFVFTKPTPLTGPNITTTATDGAGNTSGFSAPSRVPGPRRARGRRGSD